MAFKKVPLEIKVTALKEAIELKDIKVIAEKYGISEVTIKKDYIKLIDSMSTIIENKKPGPKFKGNKVIKIRETKPIKQKPSKEELVCENCGSKKVSKNGTYTVANWLLKMIVLVLPFLKINTDKVIQKYICKDCNAPVHGKDFNSNKYVRQAIKLQVARLICILRFKEGLSIRAISYIVKSIFGVNGSTGYVKDLCKKVSEKGKLKLEEINSCVQKEAKVMIFDETFPKTKSSGTTNLGVVVDENGLIRGVQAIAKKKDDLKRLFKKVTSGEYAPRYFLSDYDPTYPVIIKEVVDKIIVMKDFVHATRQIYRDARTAINKLTVNGIGNLTKQKQKEITELKKNLLNKQVNRILYRMRKGFKNRYASVGTIYIEGALSDLKELANRFPSLSNFYKKTEKFIDKYIAVWALQMEKSVMEGIPTSSNIIESKNSIFKAFIKKAKCYENESNLECFFSTVALFQNFDIKTRGINEGTSAISRAEIDLDEFGCMDFFEAIDLNSILKSDLLLDEDFEEYALISELAA